MLRCRRLPKMAKFLFRILELYLALVFLSWTSSRMPFAVSISGDYFRHLITVIVSPLFIFVLGNLIVLTLLTKSGLLSGQYSNSETDLHVKFININSENRINFGPENSPSEPERAPEEIVYQDKQIICELNTISTPICDANEDTLVTEMVSDPKVFRKSQSENLKRECGEKTRGNLRRSEIEKFQKVVRSGEIPVETVDELNNEEFQRAIEAFIARQVRFHREEKFAVVLSGHIHV